jgi:hypothetical protein
MLAPRRRRVARHGCVTRIGTARQLLTAKEALVESVRYKNYERGMQSRLTHSFNISEIGARACR